MVSNSSARETILTPAISQAGRPALKSSSSTHWENASAMTGDSSRTPRVFAMCVRSSSVVAGTMRSSTQLGKLTASSIHARRLGSTSSTYRRRMRASAEPFAGRLSQESSVSRPDFRSRLSRSPSARAPMAVTGLSGLSRSSKTPGWFSSSWPVAGSWQ